MKLRTLYLAGLVILAAIGSVVVLAYLTVWQLVVFGVLFCLSSLLGMALVLAAMVWLRTRTKKSPRLSRVGQGLLLAGIFLLLQVAYFPIALGLRDLEVKRAQDFINALIPRLEEYERQYNEYPANAGLVLRDDEEIPRLLHLKGDFPLEYDNRQYYLQRGATYGFRFYLPDGFIGFQYEYCCGVDGVWTVTD